MKKYIKNEYEESAIYSTKLDGSLSDAYEDGQIRGKIEFLHELGTKLGITLKDLPEFDLDDEEMEERHWNGKDGYI